MAPIKVNGNHAVVDWASLPVAEAVKQFAQGSDVAVFSKTTCPFCDRVKALFENNKIGWYQSNGGSSDGV
jgi:hypothetical protein